MEEKLPEYRVDIENKVEIVSPRYNEDMCTEPYFSRYPFFGLPTEVEDCDIIYHE